MVVDIKQIVPSLSVQNVGFLLKKKCIKLFTVHLCGVLVLENRESSLKYPGQFLCKTFMKPDVFMCSNGLVVKFTTV